MFLAFEQLIHLCLSYLWLPLLPSLEEIFASNCDQFLLQHLCYTLCMFSGNLLLNLSSVSSVSVFTIKTRLGCLHLGKTNKMLFHYNILWLMLLNV
jgi:uncharacterized membrane protein YhhN